MNDSQTAPSRVPWPPLVYLVAMATAIVLFIVYPLPWFGSPFADFLQAFGWLVLAAVIALYVTAIRALHKAKTTVSPVHAATHLVTDGVFGVSRNPLYLGNTLLMFGVGLIVGEIWFFALGIMAGFATQKLSIEPEERHLKARFGKKYLDYAKKVRRWV